MTKNTARDIEAGDVLTGQATVESVKTVIVNGYESVLVTFTDGQINGFPADGRVYWA